MKKIILFIFALLTFSLATYAQEQSAFIHYHINPLLINPATAGVSGNHQLMLNFRNQWTGFPGAPKTLAFSYDGPIGKTFGIGATIYSEDIASINRFRAAINYAFRYQVDKLKIGFGFTTEFSQERLPNDLLTNNADFYVNTDNVLNDGIDGVSEFDATLGFFGMYNDQTWFGIAFPNIINARLDGSVTGNRDETEGYYLFNMGHRFKSRQYGFILEPSILLRKARYVPFQADVNLKGYFIDEQLIGGLSYRGGSRGAIGLLIGTKLSNFGFYYSFDVSFKRFQRYNNGSHEVTVSFSFPRKEKPLINGTTTKTN